MTRTRFDETTMSRPTTLGSRSNCCCHIRWLMTATGWPPGSKTSVAEIKLSGDRRHTKGSKISAVDEHGRRHVRRVADSNGQWPRRGLYGDTGDIRQTITKREERGKRESRRAGSVKRVDALGSFDSCRRAKNRRSITLNIVAFAPIPSANATTTPTLKVGAWRAARDVRRIATHDIGPLDRRQVPVGTWSLRRSATRATSDRRTGALLRPSRLRRTSRVR